MRERGYATPAVIITAHGDVPHAVRAMKLGAIDFLKKPLTPKQLRAIADDVIKRHQDPAAEREAGSNPAMSAEETFEGYLQEAKRLINLQKFGPARTNLSKALALEPLSPEAFNLAGVLFESLEDNERAKKYYSQAIKIDKRYELAQQNMRRVSELLHSGSSKEPIAQGNEE